MQWIRSRITEQQLQYSYIWKTLLTQSFTAATTTSSTNIRLANNNSNNIPQCLYVAGGSDAPIETPNPFTGMYDAIYRTNKHKLQRYIDQIFYIFSIIVFNINCIIDSNIFIYDCVFLYLGRN